MISVYEESADGRRGLRRRQINHGITGDCVGAGKHN